MIRAGQRLKEERLKKNLTIDVIASATKIKAQFLASIEEGDYQNLPSATYTQGFVKNYARFLGIDDKEILALFRREFGSTRGVNILPQGFAKEAIAFKKNKFIGVLKIAMLFFLTVFIYIFFQYRYAIISPPLKVLTPKDQEIITSKIVNVAGKTDPNATVFVNNNLVSLDGDGAFRKTINVFPGRSTIKIKAINRFGKETIVKRQIEVKE